VGRRTIKNKGGVGIEGKELLKDSGMTLLPILRYGWYNGQIMKLSREEVLHIARLARLGLTDAEIDRFREQLSNILENFEVLQQVDTTNVLPTAQPIPLQNVTRDDEVADSLPQSQVLANAPRKDGEYFRVRAVLE
jgi:aspartyl-tRNA(Asn)/glutamyl-tRNA(Gln) amidotransferase subunit C